MIPKEILKKIRRIQIITSRLVSDVFCGQYHSVFKGKGIEFSEVREYEFGDEVRFIDWNVTARFGRPFVKKFVEERELTVILVLDLSRSFYFGTFNKLKRELCAEIGSILAFSAIRNNDKVGLIIFSDRIEKFIPPKKGTKHVLRIIREILYFKPQGEKTDLNLALEYLNKVYKRRAVVFIISDFYSENFEKSLAITNQHHEVIAITITDPKELELPDLGLVNFYDSETKRLYILDTSSSIFKKNFQRNSLKIINERKNIFNRLEIAHIDIYSSTPYIYTLFKFFKKRERKFR